MLVKLKIKYIQSLGQKKFRDAEGVFIAEGPKIIKELLASENTRLINVFAVEEWMETNRSLIKNFSSDDIVKISDSELERISFLQTPNQVLGIFAKPFFNADFDDAKIMLLLDEIQDPGNIGTLIRTADWFGIKKIICSNNSADVFNTKVVQSSMGSIAHVKIVYEDLRSFIHGHPEVPVYATTLHGDDIFKIEKIKNGFILIGNESKGICEELLSLATHQITIPKSGDAESLNAAVAAAIVMAVLV